MSELGLFFSNTPFERVIGTYLYPYRLFSAVEWEDPLSPTKIIGRTNTEGHEVLITINGGVFVIPPPSLPDIYANPEIMTQGTDISMKRAFEEKVAVLFNHIICEFALLGVVSEPATPVHISLGKKHGEHILITSASGVYTDRSMSPSIQLIQGLWRQHPVVPTETLNQALLLELTSQLTKISPELPTFIASAYSLYAQRQQGEALLDSWIVIEQIIDWFWNEYKAKVFDKSRKERLSDTRTYTAAVRTEALLIAGIIPDTLYHTLNLARKHRNDLAHRGKANFNMTQVVILAMKDALEFLLKRKIEPPYVHLGINW